MFNPIHLINILERGIDKIFLIIVSWGILWELNLACCKRGMKICGT